MSALLNTATMPQIQAELLARSIVRGMWQITQAEQTLAILLKKQARREEEVRAFARAEIAKAGLKLDACPSFTAELPYWQWVRGTYPQAVLPYVDLHLRCLEVKARKESGA